MRNGYPGEIPFSHHPNFAQQGYQVIQELGCNQEAGRMTYLAYDLNSHQQVVIKEFCSLNGMTDLSGVKIYEQEIKILQQLNHSRIPKYINSFETVNGFYLVLEYKNAPSLGIKRIFHPEEIKQIALSILEILVYLQKQIPPIIHRDIKPENILVDDQLNAYLVDFGLARCKGAKMSLSSFVAGTPGFIPPEELFGYALTEASDLYSLGATLICLLTNTRSVDINKLVDAKFRWKFSQLLPQIHPRFHSWLQKMVEHKRQRRYGNAESALAALKPIQVMGKVTKMDNFVQAIAHHKYLTILAICSIFTLTIGLAWINFHSANAGKHIEAGDVTDFQF